LTARTLNIVTITSEFVPFAKTGGLADVSGSLARIFQQKGHNSIAIIPAYQIIDRTKFKVIDTGIRMDIPISSDIVKVSVLESGYFPEMRIYLIDHPLFNRRKDIYGTPQGDFADNALRFILFSRAALELLVRLKIQPDIIHCHDWQTGLVPAYLSLKDIPHFKNTKSVFTVHNLAYQGLFTPESMVVANLPWSMFHIDGLEFYGKVNFLKGGIYFSDHITTVSPNYSREILTPEFGCGLHGLLSNRKEKLTGILNGIDYQEWNPKTDSFLPVRYNSDDFGSKQISKRLLCKRMNIDYHPNKPLLGVVTRLAAQKGMDILLESLPRFFEMDASITILGTGDIGYHDEFDSIRHKHTENMGLKLAFDNEMAHLIYAGCDIFLMPSLYEPCGLGQLIALRYGTIPVVRNIGGLADTVIDYRSDPQNANGFSFNEYTSGALIEAVGRALRLFKNRDLWQQILGQAMICDYSWEASADKYLKLFNTII
jgi:starch synthase